MEISTVVNVDKKQDRIQRVRKLQIPTLRPISLARHSIEYNVGDAFDAKTLIYRQNILNLYHSTDNIVVEKEVLKKIIECRGLKKLDSYYRENIQVSIVQLVGTKDIVTIQGLGKNILIRKKELYKVKKMKEKYIGENEGKYFGCKVKYLTEDERDKYRLDIINGQFYQNEKLFTSKEGKCSDAIYVMDGNGVFYCKRGYDVGLFHHSSFLGGEPVACAGEFIVKDGKLVSVNNFSGHYQPSGEMLKQVVNELRNRGINLQDVEIYEDE